MRMLSVMHRYHVAGLVVVAQSGDLLPLSLLQDYICYAREHVHPTLSPEAAAMLKTYFLTLRHQQQQQPQGLRVATRQLESLIRLCQVNASHAVTAAA